MKNTISQEQLRQNAEYNPITGEFRWLLIADPVTVGQKISNARRLRGGFGWKDDLGYLRVEICGGRYRLHQLAFLFMTGSIPAEIDHINQDRSDNRWSNLRPVTREQNTKNRKRSRKNKSGHTGVYWCQREKRWISKIGRTFLGQYMCKDAAINARKRAEKPRGYHENHGVESV